MHWCSGYAAYAFGSYGGSGKELKVKPLFTHRLVSNGSPAERIVISWSTYFLWKNRDSSVKPSRSRFQVLVGDQVDTPDFPTFSFNSVASATGDFSEENKLGQGGFGTVYKVNIN